MHDRRAAGPAHAFKDRMARRSLAGGGPPDALRLLTSLRQHARKSAPLQSRGAHEQHRCAHHASHRRHAVRPVRTLSSLSGQHRDGARRTKAQRVPVGRAACQQPHRQCAGGAGTVLDQNGHTQLRGQALGQPPCHLVADATGRMGHQNADRARWQTLQRLSVHG